jgi:hypothetical protein
MFADDTLLRFTHHRDHSRNARIVRWRPHEPVTRLQTLHGEDRQIPYTYTSTGHTSGQFYSSQKDMLPDAHIHTHCDQCDGEIGCAVTLFGAVEYNAINGLCSVTPEV